MENIRYDVKDYVAVVTLAKPKVNALSRAMRFELTEAFDEINERPDVRCAVLNADGHVFCAGADLKDRPDTSKPGDGPLHSRIVRETSLPIRDNDKPVICAVQGAALGAGFGLAMACDIVFASKKAVFGMPEINVGLAGGASLLMQHFGRSRMRRMMFTGENFDAEELYRLGVIEAALDDEDLMPTVMAMAHDIASKNPTGMKIAKRSANLVELMSPRDGYIFEQKYTLELGRTENAVEARTARLEKRQPVFKDE
ncbi:enoyl-CoA hydratase/isomerase family protein [Pseudooceanicola sp.]|uniref:enoyl-CoA hydratase/isomerase family protein n=1 Tax=Pseudooceanicola sp. TaxID=1914328 RepID=UPI0026217C44|nr:enoyl-CoA hydratase/isomerase family protein [Pseudooceanicola sp.]MDF1854621.1 enoyl-CoA hydratase/isomerase family protein [Pseudooceanicola sp.]